ncbi:hypothetical protein AB1Y20_010505 [Prymnesium parvum]|uniref:PH domain-containing protein n=1 Tax=Prymnesium parvum TaxID=97485 RepID=A0AB34IPP6_PRYPA
MEVLRRCCPSCFAIPPHEQEMAPLTEDGNTSDGPHDKPTPHSWASSMLDVGRRLVSGTPDPLDAHYTLLHAGATMRLRNERGSDEVQIQLSSDRSMLVWRGTQPSSTGVIALCTIRKVGVPPPGWFSAPSPGEFAITAEGIEVRLDSNSAQVRAAWVEAVQAVAARAVEEKEGRKLGHETRRRVELEMRKREADRRKAEVMKGIHGGMKHTAQAMLSR